jgi:hypothetical protein
MVVGFFPLSSDEELRENEGLASALDHLSFAMNRTRTCLETMDVPVRLIRANEIVFNDHGQHTNLFLRDNTNNSIGCYLVAPNHVPKIVRGTGASFLQDLCPAAAAIYFDAPQCCPEGLTCCPDGSLRDHGASCDG